MVWYSGATSYVVDGLAIAMACVILVAQSHWAPIKGRLD